MQATEVKVKATYAKFTVSNYQLHIVAKLLQMFHKNCI